MKTSLSLMTLLRTPLKTLLAFLLLAATSYVLFFSAAEYAALTRERERAVDFYQGVSAVEVDSPQYNVPGVINIPAYGLDVYLYADERVGYNPYGTDLSVYRHTPLSREVIDIITSLPYVTSSGARYMTAGVTAGDSEYLRRAYISGDFFNFTTRFIAEVTPEREAKNWRITGGTRGRVLRGTQSTDYLFALPPEKGAIMEASLYFIDTVLLGGNHGIFGRFEGKRAGRIISYDPITVEENYVTMMVTAYEYGPDNADGSMNVMSRGSRAPAVQHYGMSSYNDIYSVDSVTSFVPGERYIIIGRYSPMVLSDQSTFNWWPQIYPLKGLPENYLELDEFEPLRKMLEITDADLHTLDVVYTDDMSAIMRIAEGDMIVNEGRMLTHEDSDNGNKVCVMSYMYMREYGLKVGDRITLKLGDKLFEQNPAIGAVASVRERYADSFTDEIEFEIVGSYRDVDKKEQQLNRMHWTYSANTVFIPQSFLPCSVPDSRELTPGEFSFIIDDPRNIASFLEECAPVIESLGLTLYFSDGGWLALEAQVSQASTLAAVRLLLLSLSVFVAIGLTVYLFIGRKKKEYAIMRALGTPVRASGRSLYIPLGLMAVVALVAGNLLAGMFTGGTIERALKPFAEAGYAADVAASASVPATVTLVCVICELAALALVTAFGLRRIRRKPPLELLQDRAGGAGAVKRRGGRKTENEERGVESGEHGKRTVWNGEPSGDKAARTVESGEYGKRTVWSGGPSGDSAARAVESGEYGKRTVWSGEPSGDSAAKAVENRKDTILLSKSGSAAFAARHIARHIRRSAAKSLLSLGLALLLAGTIGQFTVIRSLYADIYDNIRIKAHFNSSMHISKLIDLEKLEYLSSQYYINEIPMHYSKDLVPIKAVMTNDISRYSDGLAEIEFLDGYDNSLFRTMSWHTTTRKTVCVMPAVMMDAYGISLGDQVPIVTGHTSKQSFDANPPNVTYTVVGRVSGGKPDAVFFPFAKGFEMMVFANELVFDYCEVTLESPLYTDEFRVFVKPRIVNTVGGSKLPFVMDTSEADNTLRTMNLMSALYPIAAAAAAILAGLFPGLIIMQTDRDASIMRVLGATKKRTRAMLLAEQAVLCLAGLALGAILLFIINGALPADSALPLAAYAALQLAACATGALICSVVITRRRPLELLQVRE